MECIHYLPRNVTSHETSYKNAQVVQLN